MALRYSFHYLRLIIGMTLSYLVGTGCCQAQSLKSVNVEPSLAEDVRLQQRVSVEATGIPLEELLARLSSKELRLTAGRSCAAQKLQVRLKERSLLQVMQSLSELLPGGWQAKTAHDGYILNMSARAVDRREAWWRAFLTEREKLREPQIAAALGAIQSEPPKPGNEEMRAIQAQYEAKWRFFTLLPPDLQQRVAASLGSNMRQYQLSAGGTMAFLGGNTTANGVVLPLTQLPEAAQSQVRTLAEPLDAATAYIRLRNNGASLQATLLNSDGTQVTVGNTGFSYRSALPQLPLDHRMLAFPLPDSPPIPLEWKFFVEYQKSTVWKNDPPDKDRPAPARPQMFPPHRADVLNWLGVKADMEFVADYYSQPSFPIPAAERDKALTIPLKVELDFRAAQQDMSWKQTRDQLYLFRDNRWYRDDYLEVPAPEMRKLTALTPSLAEIRRHLDAKEATRWQLPRVMEIMQNLTPWQIANGLMYAVHEEEVGQPFDLKQPKYMWRPFGDMATAVLAQYDVLRFYVDLPPEKQLQLRAGNLPLSALNAAQQQQALALLSIPPLRPAEVVLQMQADYPLIFNSVGSNPAPIYEDPIQFQIVVAKPAIQTAIH